MRHGDRPVALFPRALRAEAVDDVIVFSARPDNLSVPCVLAAASAPQRPDEGAEDHTVEDKPAKEDERPAPVEGVQKQLGDGRQEEHADTGAADGDTSGQGALLLEVDTHWDDGGKVHQAESNS